MSTIKRQCVILHAEAWGEYKVGKGLSAYYTGCEEDAVDTAKHMLTQLGQDVTTIEFVIKPATIEQEDNW